MAQLIFVVGGTRSGKSRYALELAEKISEKRLFVATCPAVDEEMEERVGKHRLERQGRGWRTVEEELDLGAVFSRHGREYDVILIDCVTLWVSNVLFRQGKNFESFDEQVITRFCAEWLQRATSHGGTVICVSNEVGMGVVPENRLARKYRDLVGLCNRMIAAAADTVTLVSCGLPLHFKQERK